MNEYELKNKEFKKWYKRNRNNLITLESIENLIDIVVNYYEKKYPNNCSFSGCNNVSKKELLRILNTEQMQVFNCFYTGDCCCLCCLKDDDGDDLRSAIIYLKNKYANNLEYKLNHNYFYPFKGMISVNAKTGIVEYISLNNYGKSDIPVEDLLILLEKEKARKIYSLSNLKECVNEHKYYLELRKRIIEQIILKIIYSKNTTIKDGLLRSKLFINEINSMFNLDTSIKNEKVLKI